MRGKLAIGVTANFVNRRSVEETQVPEISGVARIYNQKFFQGLLKATGQGLPQGPSPPGSASSPPLQARPQSRESHPLPPLWPWQQRTWAWGSAGTAPLSRPV